MRTFIRNLVASVGIALSVLAVATMTATFAQVIPSTSTTQRQPLPRYYQTQQTHYIRSTLTFNMCVQSSNACAVKLANASLPYNSIVLRVTVITYTAWNSTTSDVITVGTTSANANEIVSSSINHRSQGTATGTVVATHFNSIGGTASQTGSNGGFDIWVKWTAGTGNTATTGLSSIIIEYVPGNDGNCAPVALGATAAGC
jgi:hypothetical protein